VVVVDTLAKLREMQGALRLPSTAASVAPGSAPPACATGDGAMPAPDGALPSSNDVTSGSSSNGVGTASGSNNNGAGDAEGAAPSPSPAAAMAPTLPIAQGPPRAVLHSVLSHKGAAYQQVVGLDAEW
jgi:hypothetical protein